MKLAQFDIKPLAATLIVAGMLSACGGGGGGTSSGGSTNAAGGSQQTGNAGGSSGNSTGNTDPSSGGSQNPPSPTVMSCSDGTNYQCSGKNVAVADSIAFTEFGVQTYGRSTSDVNHHPGDPDWSTWATKAEGLQLDSGGSAEVRIARNTTSGAISRAIVMLDNIGISWNKTAPRPRIIETFDTEKGRVKLDNDRVVADDFHESTDTVFYDYARKGVAGTQDHYANNRYFPRSTRARCGQGAEPACPASDPTRETDGLHYVAGSAGQPDTVTALRFHEDGDIHAGDALDGGWLAGGTGHGAPFPGSKGYRNLFAMSFQYANLADWFTQDTVSIAEWTGANGSEEHNSNRRGIVAFGALTNPAMLPTSGTVTYRGTIHGRYAKDNVAEPVQFDGTVSISMDFAGKTATITVTPASDSGASPVGFTTSATLGKGSGNLVNALSGSVNNGKLSGSVAGRYFGPVVSTGTGGTGPAEAGGTFALKNAATGEAVIGGFIARKQ